MIKKIKLTILTIIIIIFSFFTIRTITNGIIILLYNNGTYPNILIKSLYLLNINEPYIVYYNNGNINYQKKEYDKAIENYTLSLENNPPEKRVCMIRVNLSLATINNIKVTDKEAVLNELRKARNYLYENDCAHEADDNGKNKKAEELEQEIKELEKQVEEGSEENNNSNKPSNQNNQSQQNYDNIEEQLKKQQKQNNAARNEKSERDDNLSNYEYYKGKRW